MSSSFDNFWLLQAMRYGIPALLLLVLGIAFNLRRILANRDLTPADRQCRTGHVAGAVALFFTLATVHVWGPTSTVVMFYIGAGVWLAGTGMASEAAAPDAARGTRTVRRVERRRGGPSSEPEPATGAASGAEPETSARRRRRSRRSPTGHDAA